MASGSKATLETPERKSTRRHVPGPSSPYLRKAGSYHGPTVDHGALLPDEEAWGGEKEETAVSTEASGSADLCCKPFFPPTDKHDAV